MTVHVSNFNIGRGGTTSPNAPNQFSDTFNRASGGLGKNWIQTMGPFTPIINPVGCGTWSIGACSDASQGCILSYVGSVNPGMWWSSGLICAPLYMSCWGLSQFSEWKLITLTDGGLLNVIGGPSVLNLNTGQLSVGSQANGHSCYSFQTASDGSAALRRGNAGAFTTLASVAAATISAGDVLRLEAVVVAGVSTVLTAKKNGSTIMSFSDIPATMLVGGSPGHYALQIDGTAAEVMVYQFRNFNGGRL